MESWIQSLIDPLPLWALFVVIAVFLYTLARGADILVAEAVTLSIRWGVPTLLIGATIVSLGTTLPETAVSVVAALGGRPGLALGNAVGSIICDTGLILGLAAILRPIPLDKTIVNRQGWIQLGSGFLLVLMCLPWSNLGGTFREGGRLPQWAGWLFVALLVLYIWKSIQWAKRGEGPEQEETHEDKAKTGLVFLKLLIGVTLVILSSKVLIPTVEETAFRLNVPEAIIAATLVAFGTSLPELVTVITAVLRGHAGLALGNVIGADILNVLFVAGVSASVTQGGLYADPRFFQLLFPAMLFILIVFRLSVWISKTALTRWSGFVLLGTYIAVTALSYYF
ncbi:MAG: calcium/sodium antiporter [Oceanipulchritudo sp.]|jgi:cation:H+ antiporter